MEFAPLPPHPRHPDVVLRASRRRKKTVGAHWEGDHLVVTFPVHVRRADRERYVEHFVRTLSADRPNLRASDELLEARAAELADRFAEGVRPSSIRWSERQKRLWGSCTTSTREIRISSRLRTVPDWVLDVVIVHELLHLVEPGHSARFRELERQTPRFVEASAYLEGYALGLRCDRTPD